MASYQTLVLFSFAQYIGGPKIESNMSLLVTGTPKKGAQFWETLI